ncbi:hypothetical protein J6590_019429 [Homalodisca vitripennis]|nr:hypothetical protein J6590_019429 [Homalodisca vitripennis]
MAPRLPLIPINCSVWDRTRDGFLAHDVTNQLRVHFCHSAKAIYTSAFYIVRSCSGDDTKSQRKSEVLLPVSYLASIKINLTLVWSGGNADLAPRGISTPSGFDVTAGGADSARGHGLNPEVALPCAKG